MNIAVFALIFALHSFLTFSLLNLNKFTQLDDSTFTRIISFDQAHRMRLQSGRMPVITVANDFPHEVAVKCQLVHNSQSVSQSKPCNQLALNAILVEQTM